MPDFVFNIAKGHVSEYAARILGNDPATSKFTAVLLNNSVADATAEDYDNLSLVLGDAGTVESLVTNYARKDLDETGGPDVIRTVDDTNNRIDIDTVDITWTALGNGVNELLSDLIFCYNPTGGVDTTLVPVTQHDFVIQTDGSDVTAQVTNFFRAS